MVFTEKNILVKSPRNMFITKNEHISFAFQARRIDRIVPSLSVSKTTVTILEHFLQNSVFPPKVRGGRLNITGLPQCGHDTDTIALMDFNLNCK